MRPRAIKYKTLPSFHLITAPGIAKYNRRTSQLHLCMRQLCGRQDLKNLRLRSQYADPRIGSDARRRRPGAATPTGLLIQRTHRRMGVAATTGAHRARSSHNARQRSMKAKLADACGHAPHGATVSTEQLCSALSANTRLLSRRAAREASHATRSHPTDPLAAATSRSSRVSSGTCAGRRGVLYGHPGGGSATADAPGKAWSIRRCSPERQPRGREE